MTDPIVPPSEPLTPACHVRNFASSAIHLMMTKFTKSKAMFVAAVQKIFPFASALVFAHKMKNEISSVKNNSVQIPKSVLGFSDSMLTSGSKAHRPFWSFELGLQQKKRAMTRYGHSPWCLLIIFTEESYLISASSVFALYWHTR